MKQIFLTSLATIVLANSLIAAEPTKPNVVFILIDDLGQRDVGFMEAQHYHTPNIDRIATAGIVFDQAYSCGPNCAPSRACVMSGQYSPRHGVYTVGATDRGNKKFQRLLTPANRTTLDAKLTTMAEVFHDNGYVCAHLGKWHLGGDEDNNPLAQGFHENFGGNQTGSPKGGHFSPYKNPQLADGPKGEYLTDRLTDEAVKFIEANRTSPFFVHLSHYAVHTPIQAKGDLTRKYQARADADGFNAKYAAMIESVDQSVGAVLDVLEKNDLTKNTIVVFYSDNGGFAGATNNAPLRGSKGMLYEGGIRVPLAIQWPAVVAAGSKCSAPVCGVDFFPTFVDAIGANPPDQPLDGTSLIPLLKGRQRLDRAAIYFHFPAYLPGKNYRGARDSQFRVRPSGAIRVGNWKLIENFEDRTLELYDLASDLSEETNLVKQQAEKAKELHEMLQRWQQEINAPIPTEPNPNFDPDDAK